MKNCIATFISMVISVLILVPVVSSESVHGDSGTQKIILISIPGLSFHEIYPSSFRDFPNLYHVVKNGAMGALNIRTPFKGIEDSYLTLGAGAPATSAESFDALHPDEFKSGERAAVLYQRYNGTLPSESEIIIPDISAIHHMNASEQHRAQPGLLGDLLYEHGINTVVLGNRDRGMSSVNDSTKTTFKRTAPFFLMDQKGLVAKGVIDDRTLLMDPARPFAVKTNYAFIQEHIARQTGPAVILVELGDLDRLYAEKSRYERQLFLRLKALVLDEIDQFIGELVDVLDHHDEMWIFSPQVHADAVEDRALMAPIMFYPSDSGPGLLMSNTTRRPGFVANVDLAPTILQRLQLPVSEVFRGSFIFQVPVSHTTVSQKGLKSGHLDWLQKELSLSQQVYQLRPKLLYSFVTYEMIVLLLGLIVAVFVRKNTLHNALLRNHLSRWVLVLLLSILIAPVVLLHYQWIVSLGLTMPVAIIFFYVLILVLGWMFVTIFPVLPTIAVLAAVTMISLLLDGFMGAEAMKRSVLGYDPMIGARYYGMGNEYMGVLIGATILAVSFGAHFLSGVERKRREARKHDVEFKNPPVERKWMAIVTGIIFTTIVIYLASPSWGTNAGGTIAACISFGIVWIRLFHGQALAQIQWGRLIGVISAFAVISLIGLWLVNFFIVEEAGQSHIGKAWNHLLAGNWQEIQAIIARKWAMNWHLLTVSSWSKVLITSLFVMAVIVLRPRGVFHQWQQQYPLIMYGFSAMTIGSIIALFVNDSGIVAAGTMIVYVAVPMLCLKLHTHFEQQNERILDTD